MNLKQVNNILLASHGSQGAIAAEEAAFDLCSGGTMLKHLVVVPELWKGMMGDDWLNNGSTRDQFAHYLESELGKEVDENCDRVRLKCEAQHIDYSSEIVLGEPGQCFITACNNANYDLAIMGSPRPKGKGGLRSKMISNSLLKILSAPLLIIPYPHE